MDASQLQNNTDLSSPGAGDEAPNGQSRHDDEARDATPTRSCRTASPKNSEDSSQPSGSESRLFDAVQATGSSLFVLHFDGNRCSGCSTRQSPASVAEAPSMHACMHYKRSSVIHWRTLPRSRLSTACVLLFLFSISFFSLSLLFTHLRLCFPLDRLFI